MGIVSTGDKNLLPLICAFGLVPKEFNDSKSEGLPLASLKNFVTLDTNVCALRLFWAYGGQVVDEDIIWRVPELVLHQESNNRRNETFCLHGLSPCWRDLAEVEAFVLAYINEVGLPWEGVGTRLLTSLCRQLVSAAIVDCALQLTCRRLGFSVEQATAMSDPLVDPFQTLVKQIPVDYLHQGMRVVDTLSWNITNPSANAQLVLEQISKEMNLPTHFAPVAMCAFLRSLHREKLKFIAENRAVFLPKDEESFASAVNENTDLPFDIDSFSFEAQDDTMTVATTSTSRSDSRNTSPVCLIPTDVDAARNDDRGPVIIRAEEFLL